MTTRTTRSFWPMRDLPAIGWLLAAAVVAVIHSVLPAPTWLLIHLVLLGAATHSILVWSRHFTETLLHTPTRPGERAEQTRRLILLNVGVLLVVVGVPAGWWWLTVVGGTAVAVAALWHGAMIVRKLRTALPARFRMTVRYYVASAALLPIGVTFGIVLARLDDSNPWHGRLMVAHASVNLLGWVGITALGTLVTLWPSMLRTRIAPGAERSAARALPMLTAGVLLAGAGPLLDVPVVLALGLAIYLVGLGVLAVPWVKETLARGPESFATYSVAAAMLWLTGTVLVLTAAAATNSSWAEIHEAFEEVAPFVAIGFGAQLLLGALAYLVPVVLGGGPSPVRAANAVFDRWTSLRVGAANAGLLLALLPLPSTLHLVAGAVALLALGSFLPLLTTAMRTSRSVRSKMETAQVPSAER